MTLPPEARSENSGEVGGQFVILDERLRSRAVPTTWGILHGGGAADATFGGCLHYRRSAARLSSHFPTGTSICGQGTYDDD
jgi:hypothetical protein